VHYEVCQGTFDLLDGSNTSIHYRAELNIFQVHSDRIIEEHETVKIAFAKSTGSMTLNQMLNQKIRIPLTFPRNRANGLMSTSSNHAA
jgi:hypothetical protein